MTTLEILIEARKRIADRWAQAGADGCLPRGTHCATSATSPDDDGIYESELAADALVREALGEDDVVAWNDTPGRTKEEVLAVFDKSIGLAKAEQ